MKNENRKKLFFHILAFNNNNFLFQMNNIKVSNDVVVPLPHPEVKLDEKEDKLLQEMTSPATPVTISTTPSERRIQICFGRRHLLRQRCVTDEEFFVATNLHLFFDALVDFDADLIFTSGLKKYQISYL